MTDLFEPGDADDVVGQRVAFQGFSTYAFHDLEPVTITDAVVKIWTDSLGIPVRGAVQPQYLGVPLGSIFSQSNRRDEPV